MIMPDVSENLLDRFYRVLSPVKVQLFFSGILRSSFLPSPVAQRSRHNFLGEICRVSDVFVAH